MVDCAPCPGDGTARMESERRVYLLYCEDDELGDRLERVLGGRAVQRVSSREALLAPTMSTCAVVFGLTACSDGEIEWLESAPGPLSPPRIVVAHLSMNCLNRLYPLRSGTLRVVWADEVEVEDRLVHVLDEFERGDWGPIWHLGLKLLSDPSLRPSVREMISRACGLQQETADTPFVPEPSVVRLACHLDLASATLRQYWRREVPLRCSLKEFLTWTVLFWAVRARARDSWDVIAIRLRIHRRTLERNFIRLAGCGLAAAAADPDRLVRRFHEWVDSVWDPHSVNRPGKHDSGPVRAPLAPMSQR